DRYRDFLAFGAAHRGVDGAVAVDDGIGHRMEIFGQADPPRKRDGIARRVVLPQMQAICGRALRHRAQHEPWTGERRARRRRSENEAASVNRVRIETLTGDVDAPTLKPG